MNTTTKRERSGSGWLIAAYVCFGIAGVATLLLIFSLAPSPPVETPAPEVAAAPAAPARRFQARRPVQPAKQDLASKPAGPEDTVSPLTLEEHWGIQVASLRLSMGNSIIDLRYKILDPVKTVLLAKSKTPSYILDQASGKKLIMPTPPKEGAFPPTANKLIPGKTYFAMVSNQGGTLKSGSQVTLMVGGSQATNLTVE